MKTQPELWKYAYNDWCIYQLAKELKRPEKEIQLFAKSGDEL